MQALQQKWEYASEHPETFEALETLLAQRGAEGWELVNVVGQQPSDPGSIKTLRQRHGQWYAFFKRPALM